MVWRWDWAGWDTLWLYDAWMPSHVPAINFSPPNQFYSQTISMLNVSDTSVVSVGFSGSPSTSGIRHPSVSLNLSSDVDNSVSPAALCTVSDRKAASICSADTFAELAVAGVLQSIVQLFPNIIIRIPWTSRTSWLPLAVPFSPWYHICTSVWFCYCKSKVQLHFPPLLFILTLRLPLNFWYLPPFYSVRSNYLKSGNRQDHSVQNSMLRNWFREQRLPPSFSSIMSAKGQTNSQWRTWFKIHYILVSMTIYNSFLWAVFWSNLVLNFHPLEVKMQMRLL